MRTVLVVDDDAAVRESVAELLCMVFAAQVAADAVRFHPVAGGLAAVELSLRDEPSLLIMDVSMPDMDGVEAFFRIADGLGHSVPTVFLTGFASSGEVRSRMERALAAGALGCLSKPATAVELAAAVREALPGLDD